MKIRRIHFRNLNSLAGVWTIDLTGPSYETDGIFAITGATGAGKTTILDAISLALYGRTPRLDRINQGTNEVMSRHTGECYAEIEFETGKGVFISRFSQNRARKNPGGELQQPRVEISEKDTGRILAEKKTEFSAVIERLTGMTFEQFTRSVMLAQGEFAAFLDASDDDRGQILEQITGTGIYGEISMQVHEREAEERDQVKKITEAIARIPILETEEKEYLLSLLHTSEQEMLVLGDQSEILRADIAAHAHLAEYHHRQRLLQEQKEALVERKKQVAPDIDLLFLAERARGGEQLYHEVRERRRQHDADCRDREECNNKIPILALALEKAIDSEKEAANRQMQARRVQGEMVPLIRQVREYDTNIKNSRERVSSLRSEYTVTDETVIKYQQEIVTKRLEKTSLQERYTKILQCLEENQTDAVLETELEPISRIASDLQKYAAQAEKTGLKIKQAQDACYTAESVLKTKENHYADLTGRVEKAKEDCEQEKKRLILILGDSDLASFRRSIEDARQRHNHLLDLKKTAEEQKVAQRSLSLISENEVFVVMHRQELDLLIRDKEREKGLLADLIAERETKARLIQRIAGYEEERKRLVPGEPCPLCGSCSHPYREGEIPADETIDTRLADDKAEMERLLKEITRLESDRAGTIKEEEIFKQKREELQGIISHLQPVLLQLSAALLPGTDHSDDSQITLAIEDCEREVARCSATISEAEKQETVLRTAQTVYAEICKDQVSAEHAQNTAALVWEQKKSDIAREEYELSDILESLEKGTEEFSHRICMFTDLDTAQKPDVIVARLAGRREQFRNWTRDRDETRHALDLAEYNISQLSLQLHNAQEERDKKEMRYQQEKTICLDLVSARQALFGDADPDREEDRIAREVAAADADYSETQKVRIQSEQEKNAMMDRIQDLTKRAAAQAEKRNQAEREFSAWLSKTGFGDEESFTAALLPESEYLRIRQVRDEIIHEDTIIATKISELTQACESEQAKIRSREPVAVLKEMLTKTEEEYQSHANKSTLVRDQLDKNSRLLLERQELEEKRTAQQREYDRWYRLDQLIGSHDGKAFRMFAQGLTFELLIHHANTQLAGMTDRYILFRDPDPKNPLLISVIDTYQAGIVRSVKNLSGGERFIISLALALGLSSMASATVSVDSLFLDEGFGSLDETALEMALSTLAGLKQNGKLIGIISHVPALKERIPTQIVVEKGTGGRSSLSGPGVTRE